MIVNWKKKNAGVLVLPCMKKNILIKQIFIVPGHNDVPDEDWSMARISKSVQRKLEAGLLEELKKEVKTPSKSSTKAATGDLLDEKVFPYNEAIKALKTVDLHKAVMDVCVAETGKKSMKKDWLIGYFKDETEDWEKVKAELGGEPEEETETELTSITLMEMSNDVATDVISDTYNLNTLEKWKKEVSQPDLRVLILNQIEEVNRPPVGGNK